MDNQLKVHLTALGLLGLLIGVIILFWSYPQLLVYLLLAIVAALAYGALYLILAAKMDPKPRKASPPQTAEIEQGQGQVVELRPRSGEPPKDNQAGSETSDETIVDEEPTLVDPPKDDPPKKAAAKRATRKKKKAPAKKKSTKKKSKNRRASGSEDS